MKNILLIAIFLFGSYPVFAQPLVNGDFGINNGNDMNCPGCAPPAGVTYTTFSDGSVPNWVRSHGSPLFGCSGCVVGTTAINMGSGYLANTASHPSDGQVGGAGIMGGYNFTPGGTYYVEIDIVQALLTEGKLNIYAAYNINRNLVMKYPGTDNCESNLPTASSKTLIGSLSGFTISSPTTYNFTVTIPAGTMYDKIWVYPEANSNQDDANVLAAVDALRIGHTCQNTLTFSSGTVPAGVYQNYAHINGGSSFGTGTTAVQIDPNGTTELDAGQDVTLANDFVASVNGTNTFVAEIVPCDIVAAGKSAPSQISAIASSDFNRASLTVYPNPATQEITVTYPSSKNGSTTFIISRIDGSIIKRIVRYPTTNDTHYLTIDVSAFSPGTYILRALNTTFSETTKFSVVH